MKKRLVQFVSIFGFLFLYLTEPAYATTFSNPIQDKFTLIQLSLGMVMIFLFVAMVLQILTNIAWSLFKAKKNIEWVEVIYLVGLFIYYFIVTAVIGRIDVPDFSAAVEENVKIYILMGTLVVLAFIPPIILFIKKKVINIGVFLVSFLTYPMLALLLWTPNAYMTSCYGAMCNMPVSTKANATLFYIISAFLFFSILLKGKTVLLTKKLKHKKKFKSYFIISIVTSVISFIIMYSIINSY